MKGYVPFTVISTVEAAGNEKDIPDLRRVVKYEQLRPMKGAVPCEVSKPTKNR